MIARGLSAIIKTQVHEPCFSCLITVLVYTPPAQAPVALRQTGE